MVTSSAAAGTAPVLQSAAVVQFAETALFQLTAAIAPSVSLPALRATVSVCVCPRKASLIFAKFSNISWAGRCLEKPGHFWLIADALGASIMPGGSAR